MLLKGESGHSARSDAVAVPDALAEYAREAVTLGTSTEGKRGGLDLIFEPLVGVTRLVWAYGRVPYAVPRALYPDPSWPALATVYLAMPTGGILQGDRISLRVRARPGAAVHVTTQSATRVYQMNHNCAVQATEIIVDECAHVEYWPDAIIPYADARFAQQTILHVAPTATLIYRDILTSGRLGHGERFAYRIVVLQTVAQTPSADPLFVDALHLEPGRMPLAERSLFGGYDVLGTAYILAPEALQSGLAACLYHC